jgi:hypothetical protein
MRFRIRARNPKTKQPHSFEVEGDSLGDARQQVEEAGLVPSSIKPAAVPDPPAPDAAPDDRPPDPPARRRPRRSVNVVLVLGFLAVVAATVTMMMGGDTTTFESLDAAIRFDGFQFRIANQDDFAWREVRIDLNGGLANSGYLHHPGTIVAGQTYSVSGTAFADEDGNRFDPVSDDPRQIQITCEIDDGKTARYTKRWN